MEPKEFYKAEIVTADFEEGTMTFEIEGDFTVKAGKYFIFSEESLQNFADRICEKQRENCAEYYNNNVSYEQKENWMYNNILEAEQPKIEEL